MLPVSLSRPLDMSSRSRKMVDLDRIGLNLRYPRRRLDNRYEAWKGWYGMLVKAARESGRRGSLSLGYIGGGITRAHYAPRTWPEKRSGGYLRKCTVKVSYSKETGDKAILYNSKKVGYIAREEATLAPGKPFYETASDKLRCYTYEGERKVMVSNDEASRILGPYGVFRIILSPEDPDVDLSTFARKFMKESFSKAIGGYSPLWIAANHYNTEHPHVHILLSMVRPRAVGNDGRLSDGRMQKYLYFNETYVKNRILYRDACRILTDFMGPRTPEQERFYNEKKVEDPGYTAIDRKIAERSHWDRDLQGVKNMTYAMYANLPFTEKQLIRKRLRFLSENNPKVTYLGVGKGWRLEAGWDLLLKKKGQLERLGLDDGPERNVVFDDRDTPAYKGIIKSFSVDDEDPEKLTFHIVDKEGRDHVLEERVGLDVDRRKLMEKEVQIGFLKNGTVPHILGKKDFEKDERSKD